MIWLLIPILAGCTSITYQDGTAKFERWSFGTNLTVMTLTASTDANGNRSIHLEGSKSNQTEALGEVAERAAKGAVQGIKP